MTTSASTISRPLDWRVWAPGFALPIACIVADFAIGEYVLWLAPAGLLCLAAISMVALALWRHPRGGGASFVVIGPMWVAGISALAIGVVLVILSPVGLLMSIGMLSRGHVAGLLFLICSLLAITPIWTGITYIREAIALSRRQAAARGTLKTSLHALLGAAGTVFVVITVHAADSGWVTRRIAALNDATPAAWEAPLASLRGYPLCGRARCRWLVCEQLFRQFPQTPPDGIIMWPDVPAPLDGVFTQAYGMPVKEACRNHD